MSNRPVEQLYLEEGEEREEGGREGRTKRKVHVGRVRLRDNSKERG